MENKQNFIGIPHIKLSPEIMEFPKAFPSDFCKEIIRVFEENFSLHKDRQAEENAAPWLKRDTQVIAKDKPFWEKYREDTHSKISKYFEIYTSYFGDLHTYLPDTRIMDFKVQRTLPGEGYHTWHFEQYPLSPARMGVWAIYLNDIQEGGETEFLYQHLRVKPKEGSLVIFPASYTHVHRGNPPLKDAKYIITGWFEFMWKKDPRFDNDQNGLWPQN